MGRNTEVQEQPIELRVSKVDQLFHSPDRYPYQDRDLDKDVEEYVASRAREYPSNQPIKIVVYLPPREAQTKAASELPKAFARCFGHRSDFFQSELTELFRDGRRFLAIGMSILVGCLVLAQIAGTYLTDGPFKRLAEQSLPILGWVANWRPLEIFLYDWWPIARRRDLYRRLATASVEVKAMAH